jgi:hypothetical protein
MKQNLKNFHRPWSDTCNCKRCAPQIPPKEFYEGAFMTTVRFLVYASIIFFLVLLAVIWFGVAAEFIRITSSDIVSCIG